MKFASVVDMEPGMWFRVRREGRPLEWLGVESIISRFPTKSRVRVLCKPGPSFVTDRDTRFQIIEWSKS